jgi:hypothetical protein
MWRKDVGLISGLLALSAFIRPLAQEPPQRAPSPSIDSPRIVIDRTAKISTQTADDGPWKTICNTQQSGSSRWRCAAALHDIKFLIATVPDPKTTNLSLFFDRSIESLVWAAADQGYSFERYWLPWKNVPEKEMLLFDDRIKRKKEQERIAAEPGLIVFHGSKPPKTLFLFLVGETPTSGINKRAFSHALGYIGGISQLAKCGDDWIRIIGPTFSGSLAPFATELEMHLRQVPALRIRLISGTITGADAVESFTKRLAAFIGQKRLQYEAVVENDNEAIKRFVKYLEINGKGPRKTALLSEDETEYGSGSLLPPTKPGMLDEAALVVRYPRQIARLRNAYQEKDIFDSSKDLPVIEGVKFTLKDPAEDEPSGGAKDSLPDFSKQQGPASQHAALLAIGLTLRNERADYIGIIATDVLDSIFLSRFLRRSCPDARLFIFDADLLFMRETETSPLAGMLSVTTYPLFSRNQHWTRALIKDPLGRRVHFTSRAAEGTYNACRALLQIGWLADPKTRGYLLDYSDPRNPAAGRPPLWLTVLGRDGYWPVALLDHTPDSSTTLSLSDSQRSTNSPEPVPALNDMHPEPPQRAWYVAFWLILLVSVLHSIYVMYLLSVVPVVESNLPMNLATLSWQVRLANKAHKRIRELLAPNKPRHYRIRKALQILRDSVRALQSIFPVYGDSSKQHRYGHKLPFLTSTTLVFTSALAFFTLVLRPYWSVPFGGITVLFDVWRIFYVSVAAFCWLLLLATLVALFLRSNELVQSRRFGNSRITTSFREYWPVTLLTLTVAICALWIFVTLIFSSEYHRGFFFAYRSLALASRVSPLTPILVTALAYFYWSWIQLRREDMIGRRQFLKTYMNASSPAVPEMARQHMVRVDGTLENIFSIHVWRPALLFISLWLLVFQPWRTLRSIEPLSYDFLYILILTTLYWLLSLSWSQFIWIWHDFRNLLQWIERDPIRNAFSRLRKEIAWVPLVSSVHEHQFFISTRCLDTLTAIRNFETDGLGSADKGAAIDLKTRLEQEIEKKSDNAHDIGNALEKGIALDRTEVNLKSYAELQAELDKLAGLILEELHAHQWKRGDSDSLRREEETETLKCVSPARRLLVLEEEFIAMRYLIFMRYIFRHLRNLLGFIVVGFIFAAISLQSYVFQSHQWIGFSSLCIFLALGIGVAIVFAEMDRDAILSRITDTRSNELGKTFAFRLMQFGALPLITVLAGQFPFIERIFFSWVRPVLDSLH